MNVRYAEDYKVGEKFNLGSYEVTLEEIINFSHKYDPFPFHLDNDLAKSSVFGGIISSGWLTALVWLRLMHKRFICYETTMGSPGHEKVIWPNPVYPGDRLSGQLEITGSRASSSKPEMGFVLYNSTLKNQIGKDVFVTASTIIVKTKVSKN